MCIDESATIFFSFLFIIPFKVQVHDNDKYGHFRESGALSNINFSDIYSNHEYRDIFNFPKAT